MSLAELGHLDRDMADWHHWVSTLLLFVHPYNSFWYSSRLCLCHCPWFIPIAPEYFYYFVN